MNGPNRQPEISIDVVIPNQTRYLDLVGEIGERVCSKIKSYSGDREALGYNLNLALTEAISNAIKYAPGPGSGKAIKVSIQVLEHELCVTVRDKGQGFDLESIPLPDLDNPTGAGLGLFLIRNIMDQVDYRRAPSGNVLEMRKGLR